MDTKFTICTLHSDSLRLLKNIKTQLKKETVDKDKILDIINSIEENIREAKRSGISMERRLKKYYYAIMRLGFSRVVKKKSK